MVVSSDCQDPSQLGFSHPLFLFFPLFSSTLRDDKMEGIGFNFFCFFGLFHDPLAIVFADGILNADIKPPKVELRDESVLPHADEAELLALSDVTPPLLLFPY